MDFFQVTINEDLWTIYCVPDEDHVIVDEDSAAQTDFRNKEIYFRKGYITLLNVKHEVCHAYFGYLYLADTTEIWIGDLEEIMCAFFADRSDKIVNCSNEIYTKLKGILNESGN